MNILLHLSTKMNRQHLAHIPRGSNRPAYAPLSVYKVDSRDKLDKEIFKADTTYFAKLLLQSKRTHLAPTKDVCVYSTDTQATCGRCDYCDAMGSTCLVLPMTSYVCNSGTRIAKASLYSLSRYPKLHSIHKDYLAKIRHCPVLYHENPSLRETVLATGTDLDLVDFVEKFFLKGGNTIVKQGVDLSLKTPGLMEGIRAIVELVASKKPIKTDSSVTVGLDETVTNAIDELGSIVSSLQVPAVSVDLNITLDLKTIMMKAGAIVAVTYAIVNRSTFSIAVALALVLATFGPGLAARAKEWFNEYMSERIRAQGGTEMIHTLLTAALVGDMCGKIGKTDQSLISDFASKAAHYPRQIAGLSAVVEGVLGLVQKVVDSIYKTVMGVDCPYQFFGGSTIKLYKIIASIEDVESSRNSNTIEPKEALTKLKELREDLQACLAGESQGSLAWRVSGQYVTGVATAIKELEAYLKSNAGYRVQPVCLFLVGSAGIGKSWLSNAFGQYFAYTLSSPYMKKELDRNPENIGRCIHGFNPQDQYFSGYSGQCVFFVDEASPEPATQGMPPLPNLLINLVNNVPMSLNMADLGSKGNSFFSSRMVLGTTNDRNWGPGRFKFVNKEAVYRRARFVSVVIKNAEDAINTKDNRQEDWHLKPAVIAHMEALGKKLAAEGLTFLQYVDECYAHLEFKLINMSASDGDIGHTQAGEVLLPSEVLALMVQDHERLVGQHTTNTDLTRSIIRSCHEVEKLRALDEASEKRYSKQFYDGSNLPCVFQQGGEEPPVCKCPGFYEGVKKLETANGLYGMTAHGANLMVRDMLSWGILQLDCRICAGLELRDESDVQQYLLNLFVRDKELFESIAKKSLFAHVRDGIKGFTQYALLKKVLLGLTGTIAAITTIIYLFRPGADKQGQYEKTHSAKKQAIRRNLVQQAGAVDDRMTSILRRNVYYYSLERANGKKFIGNVIVVSNRAVVLPNHLLAKWQDVYAVEPEAVITFRSAYDVKRGAQIPLSNIFETNFGEIDIIGGAAVIGSEFETPAGMQTPDATMIVLNLAGTEIFDSFITREEFTGPSTKFGEIASVGAPRQGKATVMVGSVKLKGFWKDVCTGVDNNDPDEIDRDVDLDEREWFSTNMVEYKCNTQAGDCGSPALVKVGGQIKIVSMHVAGNDRDTGYGLMLFSEDLQEAYRYLMALNEGKSEQLCAPTEGVPSLMDKITKHCGEVYNNHVVVAGVRPPHMPTTSKIVASPLNARFKDKVPRMLPAPLAPFRTREGDIIDPMKVATAGYGLGGIEPEVHKLNMVVESVWLSMVGATEPQAFERILPSWEEVVKPGPGWPMLNSIPRGTSAGFPYCLDHTGGKSDFFGKDEDYSFGSVAYKKLMDDVTYMENCMRKGLRPLNVCMSFLKDERRPLDRVKAGKTRLISSSNIAFSMILRKYTMGFKHFIARGRINNGIAIGTNPYSREWEQIATLHGETKDGSLVSSVAGDFGGFDKKMVVVLFQKFGDLLDKFYGTGDHESAVVRRVIIEELSYSHHVVGSQIIQWFGSNTSGNAVTIEVNSVVNLIKGRMVVAERYCKFNSVRFSQDVVNKLFVGSDKLFADTVFGDDGMMTRLSKLKSLSWFGQKQMTEDFDMIFGDEYTNESKGKSDTDDLRSMRDCTFLKRGFKFCASVAEKRNYWLAPLDINTIYGSVMWTKKDDDDFVHWRENVRGMIVECSAHETEVFNGFVDDVRKGLEGQDALLGMIFGGLTRQEDWQEILLARDERL